MVLSCLPVNWRGTTLQRRVLWRAIHHFGRERVRRGLAIGWNRICTTFSTLMWIISSPRMILLCGRFCAKLQLGVSLLSTSEFSVAHHIWPHLADGRQAVYDEVIDGLKKPAVKPELMFQLLHNTVDILGGHRANLKLSPSIEIWPLVADLRCSNEKRYQEIAQQFVEQFTDRKWKLTFFFRSSHMATFSGWTMARSVRPRHWRIEESCSRAWDHVSTPAKHGRHPGASSSQYKTKSVDWNLSSCSSPSS